MSRQPLCKNCVNFAVEADGTCRCEKMMKVLTANASATHCHGQHFDRKRIDLRKLSEIRRAAVMMRKSGNGGRKPLRPDGWVRPSRSVKIREDDHSAIMDYAMDHRMSMSDVVHEAVALLLERS